MTNRNVNATNIMENLTYEIDKSLVFPTSELYNSLQA